MFRRASINLGGFFRLLLYVLLKLLEAILSIVLTITFAAPVLFLMRLVNTIGRAVVACIYAIRPILDSTAPRFFLSPRGLDNMWGYQARPAGAGAAKGAGRNSRNVLFVSMCEGEFDGEKYKAQFESKVLNYVDPSTGRRPYLRLRQIFTKSCGYYAWREDPSFSIDNHIFLWPDYGTPVTETELFDLLSDLAKDMPEDHPQWQEIIIPRFRCERMGMDAEGFGADAETTLRILRFHHSYGDAGSWLLLYSYCMAEGKIPYAVNPLKGFPVPVWKMVLYYANAVVFGATTALRSIWRASRTTGAHAGAVGPCRLVTPYYNGQKYFDWTESVDLRLLKRIKTQTRTGIATILASVIAGALRRFDDTHPRKFSAIGPATDLGFVVAMLPYPRLGLMNRFTIANLGVPTGGGLERIQRLQTTHAAGMALATSPEPMLNYWMLNFLGLFPVWFQDRVMRSAVGTSLVFSNLPGASETFYLQGRAVVGGAGWVPLLTCAGLSISACGYRNGLRLCGVTDSAAMSKQELRFVLDAVLEEIKALAVDAEACAPLKEKNERKEAEIV